MSTTATAKIMTADELLRLPSGEFRYELLDGILHTMSPAGFNHGVFANLIGYFLTDFVRKHRLGIVLGAETGYILRRNPDTVRAPDASFVSTATLNRVGRPSRGFFVGAPDLAVEVLSPDDRPAYVDEKTRDWFAAGTQAVWNIDPKLKTVTIYCAADGYRVLTEQDTVDGSPVLPGFPCPVKEIFEQPI